MLNYEHNLCLLADCGGSFIFTEHKPASFVGFIHYPHSLPVAMFVAMHGLSGIVIINIIGLDHQPGIDGEDIPLGG